MIDLSSLSVRELLDLQKQLVLEVPRRMALEKQKVVDDLKKMAAERGFDLHDLVGASDGKSGKGGKGSRGPVAAKYRSKDGKEWTGRGRKPAWVVEHLDNGGKLEDLAI
ncbi:H-NS family nucleoid-associated regulatory protein [Chitinimonas sp.]|uniref:H-NS histone family protein n=1 Tax=Chitinimonas sp. TaxID=1934313 RepID=UPI0035AE6D4B